MDKQIQEAIMMFMEPLLKAISPDVQIEFEKEGDQWRILVKNGNESLVGNNGEVVRSIQHIVRVGVHKKYPEDRTHFTIDIDGFKNKRESILKNKIPELAKTMVIEEGKTIVLINLTGYERMIVHQMLADVKGLETNSVGIGNSRRLLIVPTSEFGSSSMDDAFFWDINKQ